MEVKKQYRRSTSVPICRPGRHMATRRHITEGNLPPSQAGVRTVYPGQRRVYPGPPPMRINLSTALTMPIATVDRLQSNPPRSPLVNMSGLDILSDEIESVLFIAREVMGKCEVLSLLFHLELTDPFVPFDISWLGDTTRRRP